MACVILNFKDGHEEIHYGLPLAEELFVPADEVATLRPKSDFQNALPRPRKFVIFPVERLIYSETRFEWGRYYCEVD